MAGKLSLRAIDIGRRVEARRSDEVDDAFWLLLRAEWGSTGERPNTAIYVSSETLLARLSWLAPACRRYEVSLAWDQVLVGMVRQYKADLRELANARSDWAALPDEEVGERLAVEGSRLVRELREFQVRDLGRLLALGHGANFSVPGAGKTTVQLATYEAERLAGRVERMLVVAPLSAFDAWVLDSADVLEPAPVLHRFDGGLIPTDTEILLTNYNRVSTSYESIADWAAAARTLVVLDEAHRMKRGRDGEWGTACLDLAVLAERRDVLTGTPAPQSPSDLVAILEFVWPGGALQVLPEEALRTFPTPTAVASVTPAIKPLFARTTKSELQLPETSIEVVPVPLEGIQREIYLALTKQYSQQFAITQRDRLDLRSMGEVVMYLLEAACNPALLAAGSSSNDPVEFRHPPLAVPADSRLATLIAQYAQYETPGKFVELARRVKDLAAEGRRVLIWTNFVRNLVTLEAMLAAYNPAVVHGGVPSEVSQPDAPRTREAEIQRFREDPSCGVLIANPAAMSEGISLHRDCNDAIYLDRTFNAGQYLQSLDRIHRLGLDPKQETNFTFLATEETIDVTVDRRIRVKANNLGQMLDDPGIATLSLPDDEDYGAPVDISAGGDLEALFAHLRGEEADAG